MKTAADDIWAILHDFARGQKELQEGQKSWQEELQEEQKARQKELLEEQKARQKELLEWKEQQKARQEEWEEKQKVWREEWQAARKETERAVKAANESIGRLGNRLGQFVEEAVRPSAVRLFSQRGIDVHEVHQNISAKRDNDGVEIDLLVVNNEDAVVIECKSHLSIDDVNEHLERLAKVKRLMPAYHDKRLSGAVAGMVIPDNVAAFAIAKGLYVIGQNGDHLELRNSAAFVAKVW